MGRKKQYYGDNETDNSTMLRIYLKIGGEEFFKTFEGFLNRNNENLNEVEARYLDLVESIVNGEEVEVDVMDAILLMKINDRTDRVK